MRGRMYVATCSVETLRFYSRCELEKLLNYKAKIILEIA